MTLFRTVRMAAGLALFALLPSCQEDPTAPAPSPTPTVSLSVDDQSIDELQGETVVRVSLSEALSTTTNVTLALSGTATSDEDYTASQTEVVIPPGSTSGALTIAAIDDKEDDDDETVIVTIESVSGGVAAAGVTSATINIVDDDDLGYAIVRIRTNNPVVVDRLDVTVKDERGVEEAFLSSFAGLGEEFSTLLELTAGPKSFEFVTFIGSDFVNGRCVTEGIVEAGDTVVVSKGVCIDDSLEPEGDDENCQTLNGACNAFQFDLTVLSGGSGEALDDDWYRFVKGVPASGQVDVFVQGLTATSFRRALVFTKAPGAAALKPEVELTSDGRQVHSLTSLSPGTEIYVWIVPVVSSDVCGSKRQYVVGATPR